jgi:hypothetical protein
MWRHLKLGHAMLRLEPRKINYARPGKALPTALVTGLAKQVTPCRDMHVGKS